MDVLGLGEHQQHITPYTLQLGATLIMLYYNQDIVDLFDLFGVYMRLFAFEGYYPISHTTWREVDHVTLQPGHHRPFRFM